METFRLEPQTKTDDRLTATAVWLGYFVWNETWGTAHRHLVSSECPCSNLEWEDSQADGKTWHTSVCLPKVRAFNKRIHHHKPFDGKRFVGVLSLRATLLVCTKRSKYELTTDCLPPDRNRSIFPFKFSSILLWVCVGMTLVFVFAPNHQFFLRNNSNGPELKFRNSPTAREVYMWYPIAVPSPIAVHGPISGPKSPL